MSTVKSKKLQVGTDASASNNFTIYQPATPDGTLRIGVGNADSPTEVGRFTSAGYKPAIAPAFVAKSNSSTTVNNATWTKVDYNDELNDSTGDYSSSRFTPSVSGYYIITANCNIGALSAEPHLLNIYKNGTANGYTAGGFKSGALDSGTSISLVLYLNGTTDYVEIYTYQTSGSAKSTYSNTITFSGCLLQQT